MKSKIVVLGLCALMSACGTSKRNDGNATGRLFLTNLNSQSFAKVEQGESGSQFYSLGSFEAAELPDELKKLPSESEIGTLSVEFEDEVYALEYSDEIKPTIRKHMEEPRVPVYLIRKPGAVQEVSFVIKKSSSFKLEVQEEAVVVKHNPKLYCSSAHFYVKTVTPGYSVWDQDRACGSNGICSIELTEDRTQKKLPGTFDLNHNQSVAHSCNHEETDWTRESRTNRSVPKAATVSLRPALSRIYHELDFDL